MLMKHFNYSKNYSIVDKDKACLYAFLVYSSESDDSWFDEAESFNKSGSIILTTDDFRMMLALFMEALFEDVCS